MLTAGVYDDPLVQEDTCAVPPEEVYDRVHSCRM
jgi:hypothetical protein